MWIKIALREVGPFTLVFFRVFFASCGLLFYFLITRRKFNAKNLGILAVIGFFNVAFPFALISWSEKSISSGLASILNSTVPLFTMLIASFFVVEDKLTPKRITGLLLGFVGVIVLMSNRVETGSDKQILGIIAMLVAACSYGASAVFARKTNHRVNPQDQSLGQMITGTLFITPAMLAFESPFQLPVNGGTYFALAWLGLLGSFVAALLWFGLINDVGPSRTSMVTYIFPLVGVVLGLIFLKETMDWHLYAGGLLILGGILIVNFKNKIADDLVVNEIPTGVEKDV
jgi:drug/metabolite transporter (DMT)-like permease